LAPLALGDALFWRHPMKYAIAIAGALLLGACAQTSTAPRTAAVAPAVQPSAEVRDSQQRLQALGFYNGPIDGVWGPETRDAVERFQASRGLTVTDRLDEPTRTALLAPPSAPVAMTHPTDVRTVQNRLRQLGYYNGPADGVWGPETQVAVERFQRSRGLPVGQVNHATVNAMGINAAGFQGGTPVRAATVGDLDPSVVRGVQQRLRQSGFYRGRIDGVWGSGTTVAMERFQRSRGLEPTGTLNPMTASALGFDPNNLSQTAQVPRRY
jgi:peptidoglycan hydrolase-like protein with peptidoglycan-binding domain